MTPAPTRVYIGMGSNLGRPALQLRAALGRLRRLPGTRLAAVSPLYRSAPLTPPGASAGGDGQPDYLNAVAALDTVLPPRRLLYCLQAIEHRQARVRAYRWAPRTLDLDILLYGRRRIRSPELTVPHAELHRRAFVLYPLQDIAPRLQIPGSGPLSVWLKRCDSGDLKRLPPLHGWPVNRY